MTYGNVHNKIALHNLPSGWLEDGIAVIDSEGRLKLVNDELRNWFGVTSDKLIDRRLNEVFIDFFGICSPPLPEVGELKSDFNKGLFQFDRIGNKYLTEFIFVRNQSGWTVFVKSVLPPIHGMNDDVIEENLRRDSLYRETFIRMLRSEARLHNLINHWPGIIFSQRADFSLSFASPRIEEFTGISEKIWQSSGESFWKVVHEADYDIVQQQLKRANESSQGSNCSFRIRNVKSGKVFYIHEHRQSVKTESGMLLGYEVVWLDVTRQTIAEKRLSTASWKEALGILTMGLAHDFSNVMSGIHGLSESFAANLEPDHPFKEGLELIKNSSLQASQIVHRIINLHHGKIGERSYYDLNQIVKEISDLVKKVVPKRLKMEMLTSQEQLPVYVDPIEFRQVVINLILNAIDAMPREGTITLKTGKSNQMTAADLVVGKLDRYPAVFVSVEDTGHGIKKEHLEMIFDPFFTTKPLNKGSGLGLYNAKLFVEKHRGAITINSTPGIGTKFEVWLPESDFTEAERERIATVIRRHTLLVVSNNDKLLETTAELLRFKGFVVVPCPYKEKAIEMIESGEYQFSAVVILLNGKRENYSDLIRDIRAKHGDLKIVVQIAGFNEDESDTDIIYNSDLTIYPGMPEGDMIAKLQELLGMESS
ncbi:MAG: ATP-binding protein [Verrucomicrobiia bacterium]